MSFRANNAKVAKFLLALLILLLFITFINRIFHYGGKDMADKPEKIDVALISEYGDDFANDFLILLNEEKDTPLNTLTLTDFPHRNSIVVIVVDSWDAVKDISIFGNPKVLRAEVMKLKSNYNVAALQLATSSWGEVLTFVYNTGSGELTGGMLKCIAHDLTERVSGSRPSPSNLDYKTCGKM